MRAGLHRAHHIVDVIVERVPPTDVPHFTEEDGEDALDVVPVDFTSKHFTKPLNVAVSVIAHDVGVDVIPVAIIGNVEGIPHNVFREPVGLNLAKGVQFFDIAIHIVGILGLRYYNCKFRAKFAE